MDKFIPMKRTAIDEKVWWCVYDTEERKFSALLCFGKYRTKKDCQCAIVAYCNKLVNRRWRREKWKE